jgi:hypothetical protein
MQLRDIISRLQAAVGASSSSAASSGGAGGGLSVGGRPPTGLSQLSGYGGSSGNLAGADAGGGSPLSKTRSKGKLIGELTQLRAAMAAAESKLGALEAQKVRGLVAAGSSCECHT